MLDERKAAILRAVVTEYIETAQPVGSGHVAVVPGVNVSSATVRNDMAVLEQEGYLRQPHTSAGRVPTEKGYRYFVDHLGEPGRLEPPQAQQVRSFFARTHGEIEQMLFDTTHLLADLTDYAAVITGPPSEAATIRSVQLVGLGPRSALAVVVLSNGLVEKRHLEFDADVGDERLGAATARISSQVAGLTMAAMASIATSGDQATDALVALVATAMAAAPAVDDRELFIGGASRMAAAFDAVDTVRQVLGILEQQYLVVTLLRDVLDRGLQVAIGTETGLAPLTECSIVVAPYQIEGESGTIGVLGPTRMNYPQALAAVAVVSERLSKRLREG